MSPREAAAAETISEIPSWPSWDSPFYDQSVRDYYGPIIAAVEHGDEGPVRADMGTNCSWVNGE